MMNAYFFQMNNLKGLAADESGSSVLVERLARSERFTVRSSAGWTSSAWRETQRRSSGQQSATQGWSWLESHKRWRKAFHFKLQEMEAARDGTAQEQKWPCPTCERHASCSPPIREIKNTKKKNTNRLSGFQSWTG